MTVPWREPVDPEVSVIIPVKNEAQTLGDCLDAVLGQTLEPLEVIVIDSGSTDGTLDIVREFPVRLLQIPPAEFDHGATRNLGAGTARGDLLAFLTGDAQPADETWLHRLVACLTQADNVAGAYSRQIPRSDASPLVKIRLNQEFPEEGGVRSLSDIPPDEYERHPRRYIAFSDVGSCIPRAVWRRFPFRPGLPMAEDQDWAKRVLEAGLALAYCPDALVVHSHDWDLPRQVRRHLSDGLAFRRICDWRVSAPEVLASARVEMRKARPLGPRWVLRSMVERLACGFAAWAGSRATGSLARALEGFGLYPRTGPGGPAEDPATPGKP